MGPVCVLTSHSAARCARDKEMGGPIGKGAATTIVIIENMTQMRRRDGRDRLDAIDIAGAESVSLKQNYSTLPRC